MATARYPRTDVSSDRKAGASGLSVTTLTIASASSLVAAVVGSELWGPGTLIGAALTPVVVAVVSEALKRPADVIVTVRQTRGTSRFDPVAEGRRGLAEGDLSQARAGRPAPERRVHRAGPGGVTGRGPAAPGARAPRSRRRLWLAVATGLVAFVVAGVVLTGSELVLGNSVGSSSRRTTIIPVKTSEKKSSEEKTTTTDTDAKTTTTETTAPTETTPHPQQTAPTTTTPPAQTPQPNSAPAAPPQAQTAPAPSPAPNAPVPAPTPSTPAPTP
jgi:hypothetical protein